MGFRLHPAESTPSFYEKWLASEGIQTMFRLGANTKQAMCFLVNPDALPQIDLMCERFPDTTVVIDHMARIGADGEISQEDLDHLLRCARHRRTYVKVSAFYALGQKTPPYTDLSDMIRQLRDAYGARRLMWASDCPFQVQPGHSYRDSIELVRSRLDFLSNDDHEWMLRGTAADVFF
jgi:predicted TIM-barrel fold metal-dependent hydrolase